MKKTGAVPSRPPQADDTTAKIRRAVRDGRVKMHVFEPSQRRLWTVVGQGGEYWVEPDLGFCSCAGFYFSRYGGRGGAGTAPPKGWCYHLESLHEAVTANGHEIVTFADDEYARFVSSIVSEL